MSAFLVLVAADLYGSKVNLELHFRNQPPVPELIRVAELTFGLEATLIRPEGKQLQPFKIAKLHIFEDRTNRWVELTNAGQIVERMQVYVFQKQTAFHSKETQTPIPASRAPSWRPVEATPPKSYRWQFGLLGGTLAYGFLAWWYLCVLLY